MRLMLSRYRYLALSSAIITFILIVMGGLLRVSDSEARCIDWPTCFGYMAPTNGLLISGFSLEYWHRIFSILGGILIAVSLLLAYKYFRHDSLILRSQVFTAALLVIQIFTGWVITRSLNLIWYPWVSGIHLGFSLLVLGFNVLLVVILIYRLSENIQADRLRYVSRFARTSVILAGFLFVLLISGVIVSRSGSDIQCAGWPLCSPQTIKGWFSFCHRILVAMTGLVILYWFWQAWRTQRNQTPILVSATATTVLFFAQALLGSMLVKEHPGYLPVLHQATAFAVWVSLVINLVTAALGGRAEWDELVDTASAEKRQVAVLLKDFLMLTKPIVVALLLVTTYAGMVIGAQRWPSVSLAFWTLLGGFMAAGGSGAVNQYIDRFDDGKMQRTQKRPIPAGRVTPGEGLAFGVALLLVSFYLLVAFVNLLAALLSLVGMVYYVLVYSIFLKKTTVQNIVIGGGAGAIPPLVGWAAATGYIDIPALFLFIVIFMWTPPHFWALALVRKNDYARAGVPMLPVMRGELETRRQILLYTIVLVSVTLILPFWGLGGAVYLVGAAILGAWLLQAAWKVWKLGGNKIAWKMYRYSSMYLAFIFFVLMLDRLL